jgi:hypothetical protein
MKTKALLLITMGLLLLGVNQLNGQWDVLDGSVLPDAATPAWTAPDGTDNAFTSVVDDPDITGNKLLKIVDPTESGKELWRLDWNIADANQGLTVVFRTKMADELLDFYQTTSKDDKIFFISPRNGAYTEALAYYYPDSLSINQNGSFFEVDYTDWTVFRLNMKGDSLNLYVGEDPEPLFSGRTPKAKADNYLSFGNNSKEPYGGYFDWVAWDLSGAYSPSDGTALPQSLTGLPESFSVTFNVTDGTNPLEGAEVEFNGAIKSTNASGDAVFINVLPGNDLPYAVLLNGYEEESGTVTVVDADVSESVALSAVVVTYEVTFAVTDGTNPLEGASVEFNSNTQTTNASGETVFTEIGPGSGLAYTVTLAGYEDAAGNVDVTDADVTENVALTFIPPTYSVTFNVTDGTDPLEGATVTFNETTATTDASGVAVFTDLEAATGLAYTIELSGYVEAEGTVDIVDADVTENVTLEESTNNADFWNIIDGSLTLENYPGWSKDRTTSGVTDGATSVTYSVVDDPDIAGNKLLMCEDLSEGSKESWKLEWNIADPDQGLTMIIRTKPTQGIIDYEAPSKPKKTLYVSPRNGAFKEALVHYWPNELLLNNAGLTYEYENADWTVYRITMKGGTMNVYIDEDPTPVMTTDNLVANEGNVLLFGDNTNESFGSYIDWFIWNLDGAYGPGEGPGLPEELYLGIEISVEENFAGDKGMKLYPNPSGDLLNISYTLEKPAKVNLDIFDISGKLIYSHQKSNIEQTGTNVLSLNIASLPSGVYFCKLKAGEKVSVTKLIKK